MDGKIEGMEDKPGGSARCICLAMHPKNGIAKYKISCALAALHVLSAIRSPGALVACGMGWHGVLSLIDGYLCETDRDVMNS